MKNYFASGRDGKCSPTGWLTALVLVFVSAATIPAQNSIGINFSGRQWSIGGNTPQSLLSSDTAGVVPQQNWNNVNPAGFDSGGLSQIIGPNAGVISDNSGTATSLTFSYAAQGMWSVNQNTGLSGNAQLMNGYSDVESSANGSYNVGNIAFSFYDVYVYISADSNGRTVGVSLNGGTQYYLQTDASGYSYSNPLIQGAATSQAGATNAHYVYFHDVSGASLQVNVNYYGNNAGVAGIQIVDASGTVYKPTLSVQPASQQLYAGRAAQFTVTATGTSPFAYQWQTNAVNLTDGGKIFGSTSNVLSVTNVSTADDGSYDVVVTNIGGLTISSGAQLTAVAPVNEYEPVVLSNNPVAYYRFNDSGDPVNTPDSPAYDYINGDNGIYGSTTLNQTYGITGPMPPNFPGFESGNSAVQFSPGFSTSQVTIPSWPINSNTVTLTAWVYPVGSEAGFDGLILNRGANVAGLNYSGSTDGNGNYTLGYTWNNDANTYGWNSGLVPPLNQWSLVALVVTPTNATIYVASTNGVAYAVHTYPHPVESFSGPITLGNDPSDASGNRVFNGSMDEVAVFNQALSQAQILSLFSSASGLTSFAPGIAVQPVSQTPYAGQNVGFSVTALGSQPLAYQWQAGTNGVYGNVSNGGPIAGATSAMLTVSNANASNQGSYRVIIANSLGSITSSPASLTVIASAYANAVLASGPIAYYGFNETGDPAGGNLTAFDYVGGFNGFYGSVVKNGNPNYGIAGPGAGDGFPEFQADNGAAQMIPNNGNGHVTVSSWNLNTNSLTFAAWIRPDGVQPAWSGVVFCRGAGAMAGLNFSSDTDVNGNRILSYTWGDYSGWNSQLAPPTNQWSFVALVMTATNATIYMFNTNGASSAMVANTYAVQGLSGTTMIGCDPYDPVARNFSGTIDEVAVYNQALSQNQLSGLYTAAQSSSGAVLLTSSWDGASLTLNWPGNGLLLQATNVTGPWTTNTGAASPQTIVPSAPQMFYRIRTP